MQQPSFYRNIIKSTSIFGLSQVVKIFVKLITNKCAALFLGPAGIGLIGLLENTLSLISSFTNFGLGTIAVREVALAHSENDARKESEIFTILERWSLVTGILGALLSIVFAKHLSQFTFGSTDKYYWFWVVSIFFLINNINTCKTAVFQGFRLLKVLVVSSIVASVLTAAVVLPLYYFYGVRAIVPVVVMTGLIQLVVNYWLSRKIKKTSASISWKETFEKGKPLLKLGLLLSVNLVFGQICYYIIRFYFNQEGATSQILGFYEVSNTLLVGYVGLVFAAMANDYFPNLTFLKSDKIKFNTLVNDQIEVGLLLVTPAILMFYCLDEFIIKTLYSDKFLPVLEIFKAGLLSVLLKAFFWPLGYVVLAKGDNKEFFRQNLISDLLNLIFTIGFYYKFGLVGVGFASVLNFSLFAAYQVFIVQKKYGFQFRKTTVTIVTTSLLFGFLVVAAKFFVSGTIEKYMIILFTLISIFYSVLLLDTKVLNGKISRIFKKNQ